MFLSVNLQGATRIVRNNYETWPKKSPKYVASLDMLTMDKSFNLSKS